MKVDMIMPQMGESIAEATISKWRKKPGEKVEKDEIILEISTDKVDSEIPSPAAGTLSEVLFKEGDVVPVKTKIAVIDSAGGAAAASAPASQPSTSSAASPSKAPDKERINGSGPQSSSEDLGAHHAASGRFVSPLVASLAAKHNIAPAELSSIPGSGQGGRVNKQDILSYIDRRAGKPQLTSVSPASAPRSAAPQAKAPAAEAPAMDWGAEGTKVVAMDNMRQLIAEHMVRSKQTSPHVYSVQEVDMTAVAKWRQKNKNQFQHNEGFSLSFTPFFLEAAVKALLKFPYVNSSVEGKKILLKKNINLGCAVALGDAEKGFGLIVPVIKRAEEKNLVGLARSLNDLALRARNKKLAPDDVSGGTFTVTNPGVFGTMIGTPIINQPQVAILCLGAIRKRPVVIDDMIAVRDICYVTLSYDHRIIDGALGGSFLAFIREYLEGWDMERELY
ncbi:MAG: diapophytoene dehydrogenase [Proteobacteria bacterium]|nr:MAG: diapophytoene dehydrogenase [Pseudomonadota bacterium]